MTSVISAHRSRLSTRNDTWNTWKTRGNVFVLRCVRCAMRDARCAMRRAPCAREGAFAAIGIVDREIDRSRDARMVRRRERESNDRANGPGVYIDIPNKKRKHEFPPAGPPAVLPRGDRTASSLHLFPVHARTRGIRV